MVRQSPLKALQSNDDPEESLYGASSLPQSLSAAFGNSPDVTDGGPGQTIDRKLHFAQGAWDEGQDQGRNDAVATASGVEKPKKVWAKKRFAENKAEKAKKRSSSKFK